MRIIIFLVLVSVQVFLGLPVSADEIQTKDGRKIEFKSLVDEGDFWDLTTPQGTKVTVKKADFDKLIPSGVKDVPLTGAQFTFDKKRKLSTVDLLSKIDAKRDGITGSWKQAGGAIVGAGVVNGIAKLQSAYTPAEEYDLTLDITRKEGADSCFVGVIGGGKKFVLELDGFNCTMSGITLVDGRGVIDNGLGIPGKFFTNGKSRTVTVMVRKEVLIVQVDGKDFFAWRADWNKLSLHPSVGVTAKNILSICVGAATYQISRWTVTAPKEG